MKKLIFLFMITGLGAHGQDFDLNSRLKSIDFQIEYGTSIEKKDLDLNFQLLFTRPLQPNVKTAFHFGAGYDLRIGPENPGGGIILAPAISLGQRHRFEIGSDFRYFSPRPDHSFWTITPAKIAYRYIGKKAMFGFFIAPISLNVDDSYNTIVIGTSISFSIYNPANALSTNLNMPLPEAFKYNNQTADFNQDDYFAMGFRDAEKYYRGGHFGKGFLLTASMFGWLASPIIFAKKPKFRDIIKNNKAQNPNSDLLLSNFAYHDGYRKRANRKKIEKTSLGILLGVPVGAFLVLLIDGYP